MLTGEFKDQLKETLMTCELHFQRMNFAMENLKPYFPLSTESYNQLEEKQISFADQLIFRFSKLQDLIGSKLFRLILLGLGEDIEIPFIDQLTRLEKLNLLADHSQWLKLRETRNLVAHEYPLHQEEYIEGLNILYDQCIHLSGIWIKMKEYVKERFGID